MVSEGASVFFFLSRGEEKRSFTKKLNVPFLKKLEL